MLNTVLIVLYVVVCISLIVIVLLQSGKGGGLAGIFGSGGGSQAIFGARAGDVMTKTTTALAVLFMVLSLALAVLSSHQAGSLSEEIEKAEEAGGASAPEKKSSPSLPPAAADAGEAVPVTSP